MKDFNIVSRQNFPENVWRICCDIFQTLSLLFRKYHLPWNPFLLHINLFFQNYRWHTTQKICFHRSNISFKIIDHSIWQLQVLRLILPFFVWCSWHLLPFGFFFLLKKQLRDWVFIYYFNMFKGVSFDSFCSILIHVTSSSTLISWLHLWFVMLYPKTSLKIRISVFSSLQIFFFR
jgi:hypothetical protein